MPAPCRTPTRSRTSRCSPGRSCRGCGSTSSRPQQPPRRSILSIVMPANGTPITGSLYHRVGALLKKPRHVEAERRGGLEVDHQLELDRGLDRKLARLRILEDAIGIGRRAPKIIDQVTSVGQQAAELSEGTGRVDGRETVARRQQGDLRAMGDHEGIRHHDQAPFDARACAAMTESSSDLSRTGAAIASTANDAAAALKGFR